jgi:hypothetical protein
MANLNESDLWEAGIYQLEEDDPVLGGPTGIDNRAPRQLANRALYQRLRNVTPWDATLSYPASVAYVSYSGTTWKSVGESLNIAPGADPEKWTRWGHTDGELAAKLGNAVVSHEARADPHGKYAFWNALASVIAASGATPDRAQVGQFLAALQSLFAAKAGGAAQAFAVALATAGTHAMSRDAGDTRYANKNGDGSQKFGVFTTEAGSEHAIPRWQADALHAYKAGDTAQVFNAANASAGTHAVNRDTGDARYAALSGNGVPFSVGASGIAGSNNAVPRWQADQIYAALAGSSWQAFSVAKGIFNEQAVRLDQFTGSAGTTGYIKIPMTQGGYRNLIINWGVSAAAPNTVTAQWYALAFPNACFCAIGSRMVPGQNAVMNVGPYNSDPTTRIAFQNYGSVQENVGYIAIGW